MSMVTAKVTIEGTKPLLWQHFTPEAIPLDGRTERTGRAGNDPEEWKRTVLMDAKRRLYILPTYVFGCLREAARHTKKGKGSIQALMAATLQVEDDFIFIDKRVVPAEPLPTSPTEAVYLYISSVRNPATKGRNVRYRVAARSGWTATFTLKWDCTIVAREQMPAVLTDAGNLVGLGDGRSIGFGRFVVRSCETVDVK
jgi:hypothetical protein